MGRSKLFNGVVAGVAGSFIGRNNDYRGYWTLGILKKFAEVNGVDVVDIPLKPQPPINTLELITTLSHRYRGILDRITIAFGLDPLRRSCYPCGE